MNARKFYKAGILTSFSILFATKFIKLYIMRQQDNVRFFLSYGEYYKPKMTYFNVKISISKKPRFTLFYIA